jgi:hypothetical protein
VQVVPRLGRIAKEITTPSDALLAAKSVGWALVLPVLKQLVPVKSLAGVMRLKPRIDQRSPSLERRIVTLARWSARLTRWRSGGNCLERGLIAYRYLGAAGARPTLVVGVGRIADAPLTGHAWVLVDGRPVGETETAVAAYTPVFSFTPDGDLIDASNGVASDPSTSRG